MREAIGILAKFALNISPSWPTTHGASVWSEDLIS